MTTTPTPQQTTQQRDRDMTEYLYTALRSLPGEIGGNEAMEAALVNQKRAAEQRRDDAELNAQLSNEIGGKNADERKLNLKAIISKDPEYIAASQEVARYEAEIELQKAESTGKRREFQAAIALAELHAARINMIARVQIIKEIK